MIEEIYTLERLHAVLKSYPCVIIIFKIESCPHCRNANSHIEELARKGKVLIVKIDVRKTQNIGLTYGIQMVPTFICFRNGVENERILGHNKPAIEKAIENLYN